MFVRLDHLKTKELQSDLDAIQALFEVSLFDIVQTASLNTPANPLLTKAK